MSWSFPHPAEYESSAPMIDIPHRVEHFDGTAWVETSDFESEDAAADYARATFKQDDIDDGPVNLVPAWDVNER